MVKVSTEMITGAIITLVMAVVFFSMLSSLIPTATTAVHNLSDVVGGGGNTSSKQYIDARANIGTGAGALAQNLDDWTGYFWIVGSLVLVISVILGVFIKGKRR